MPLRKTYLPTLNVVNFSHPVPQLEEINDMREWLDENNIIYQFKHGLFSNHIISVYFDHKEDAMVFKLRWGRTTLVAHVDFLSWEQFYIKSDNIDIIKEWLNKNILKKYWNIKRLPYTNTYQLSFKTIEDAVAFKLRWL